MIVPLIKGLALTLKHFFSRPITIQYPEEKWECYPGFRGLHELQRREDGSAKCVACQLCATVCPSGCIRVEVGEDANHERYARRYEIDLTRCVFCGFCVEACPIGAIVMTSRYELADYSRQAVQYDKERLLGK